MLPRHNCVTLCIGNVYMYVRKGCGLENGQTIFLRFNWKFDVDL